MTIPAMPEPTIPGEPILPNRRPLRPFVDDVQIRLVGTDLDVTSALDVLHEVFTISNLSAPEPARGQQVRLYAKISRRVPYSGGIR
jgi:hypothetical protein